MQQTIPAEELIKIEIPEEERKRITQEETDASYRTYKGRSQRTAFQVGYGIGACREYRRAAHLRSLEREKQAVKGPRWVKAVERKPPKHNPLVIVRNIFYPETITQKNNLGHETHWGQGYDDWMWEDTEWLEEVPSAGDDGAEREKAQAALFIRWREDRKFITENGKWYNRPSLAGRNDCGLLVAESDLELYDLFLQSQGK